MKIILSMAVALFLIGCGDEKSTVEETKATAPVHTEVAKKVAPEAQKVVEHVAKQKAAVVEKAKAVEADVAKKAAAVEKKVVAKTAEVKEVTKSVTTKVDGAKLFIKCASCHGMHAEKKALGKSQVIKDWDASKIVTALKGYKDGTYGGPMKGVMKGQVSNLDDAQIDALAAYISKL